MDVNGVPYIFIGDFAVSLSWAERLGAFCRKSWLYLRNALGSESLFLETWVPLRLGPAIPTLISSAQLNRPEKLTLTIAVECF